MSQSNLLVDTEWLNDSERHNAAQLLPDLIALCEDRGHTPSALTTERIRHIILTDATASHLEARLADMLARPSERIPGAFANAVILARQRHLRALDAFEAAYPQPAPIPEEPEKQRGFDYQYAEEHDRRVTEIMEKYAPELEPFEDPVVTAYFTEIAYGHKFHYELPKEAYTDIIRKPEYGGPIDPITREPMIRMEFRARQAKWDEIRRLKAEAKAKEEIEAKEEVAVQPETATTPDPNTTNPDLSPHTSHTYYTSHTSHAPQPQQETPTTLDSGTPTPPQDPPDPPNPSDSSNLSHHSHASHSSHAPQPPPPQPISPTSTIPIRVLPLNWENDS